MMMELVLGKSYKCMVYDREIFILQIQFVYVYGLKITVICHHNEKLNINIHMYYNMYKYFIHSLQSDYL